MNKEAVICSALPVSGSTGMGRAVLLVLGCAVGMVVGFSATYFSTLSVFLKPVSSAFGWGRAETSAIASLALLGMAVGAPITGRLIERFGVLAVILGSTVLYSLGVLALPLSSGQALLFAGLSLWLGFVAVGTTPQGYLSAMPDVFDKRLGLAMGLAMIGLGAGNALMPMLAQGWIAHSGWKMAYRYVAVIVLAGGLLACFLLYCAKVPRRTCAAQAEPRRARRADLANAFSLMRSWRFIVLAIVFFAVSSAGLGAIVHMVSLLTDKGLPLANASKVAALIGIGVLVGRAVTGLLIDVIDARYVAAVQFMVGGAGLVLIVLNPGSNIALTSLGAFAFAFVIGAEGDFLPFFVRRYFGLQHFSFLYGVQFFFFGVGGVAGPVAFGWTFDHFHGYGYAYGGAGVICVVCAGLILTLGKYLYPAN